MTALEKIFVDTSGWYAFLNAKDPNHTAIQRFLEDNESNLVTSNFVLTELLNLLVARRQKRTAIEFGSVLRAESNVSIFPISSEDEEEAWRIFQKYKDKDYSFTDCTSFVLMTRLRIEKALALDDDFVRMGFQRVPEKVEPT